MKDNKKTMYTLIGMAIMLFGFVLPAMGPVTQVGIRIVFIFAGTLFLWSVVGGPWVSLLAIALFGLSGYTETFTVAFSAAIGDESIVLTMLAFILFGGGLTASQSMQYVTRYILTRKYIAGKPYIMMATIGICAYMLAFIVNQMVSVLIMFVVVAGMCKTVEVEHGKDKIWIYMFGMVFLGAGIGQPGFVYKGMGFSMIRVFTSITEEAYTISPNGYMLYNMIMSLLLMAAFLILVKFIFRPDVSKLKNITVESMEKASDLPPISKSQKCYLWMTLLFLLMTILPTMGNLGTLPVLSLLKKVGVLGILVFWIVTFAVVKIEGKPLLNIQKAAGTGIVWNVLLMVAAGLLLGNAIGNTDLGIIIAIKNFLTPVLAGKPTLVIVFIIYLAALLITNFAVNVAMAIALMPVIVACSTQLGLNPAPIALGVMMICFVAMMTPAASPLAAFCYGEEKYYTSQEIRSYAVPISFIAVLLFTFIGYPLAMIMVGI
ncbi:MAG: hypothetical protein HFG42_11775 [Lachnospiraceae bacterium]|nr:hypothetical protein [Lachnospiraceae bacterium]